MVEGQAKKFYQGMAGQTNDVIFEDPSVINYFVIEPRYSSPFEDDGSPMYGLQDHELNAEEVEHRHFNGTRLVGMIPCSDAFGVDLIIDKFT